MVDATRKIHNWEIMFGGHRAKCLVLNLTGRVS
jgi:hypothetical protein